MIRSACEGVSAKDEGADADSGAEEAAISPADAPAVEGKQGTADAGTSTLVELTVDVAMATDAMAMEASEEEPAEEQTAAPISTTAPE